MAWTSVVKPPPLVVRVLAKCRERLIINQANHRRSWMCLCNLLVADLTAYSVITVRSRPPRTSTRRPATSSPPGARPLRPRTPRRAGLRNLLRLIPPVLRLEAPRCASAHNVCPHRCENEVPSHSPTPSCQSEHVPVRSHPLNWPRHHCQRVLSASHRNRL